MNEDMREFVAKQIKELRKEAAHHQGVLNGDYAAYIYLMVSRDREAWKIGRSRNVMQRLSLLRTADRSIELVHCFESDDAIRSEPIWLTTLRDVREGARSEWFRFDSSNEHECRVIWNFIETSCERSVTQIDLELIKGNLADYEEQAANGGGNS